MNRRICLTLITATLLAVAPVAATTLTTYAQVVKADTGEPDSNAIKLTASLRKPVLHLNPGDNWDEDKLANNIKLNHGKVQYVITNTVYTYKKNKDGQIDWDTPVYETDLKNGDEGVVVASYEVEGLKPDTNYTFLTQVDDSGNLTWTTETSNGEYSPVDTNPAVKMPFVVGSKKKATKHNYRVGTIDASSSRVRTYNSHGRFNHHYIYDQHNYKFNQRKVIKGKVYYKLYGKNRYVRANVIEF